MPKISVVIPCFFNEGNIPITTAALLENEKNFPSDVAFEYVFVDDASGDGTLSELVSFYSSQPSKTKVISLEENVGSYNAICAGFEWATGDCIVVMSADLQDPPELIGRMYEKWKGGSKVVLAVRERRTDPFFTRVYAVLFHWAIRTAGLPNMPKGGFDVCLFDQSFTGSLRSRMVSGINTLLFLLQLGEAPSIIHYSRRKREIGESQWTFIKKVRLAVNTLSFFLLKTRSTATSLYRVKKTHGV